MKSLLYIFLFIFVVGLVSVLLRLSKGTNENTPSGAQTNMKPPIFQNERTNQLAEKIKRGDIDAVRSMITAGADVKEVGERGLTLPHMALLAETNGPQIMTLLLDAGADPISMLDDGYGSVPEYAASRDNAVPEMMIVLLKHGVSPNWFPTTDSYAYSLLQHAIAGDNLPVVKVLLQHGADINYISSVSGSALHSALSGTRFEIAAFLVDAGIDLTLLNHTGKEFQGTKVVPQTALEQFCVEEGGKRGHNPLPEVAAGWRAFTCCST